MTALRRAVTGFLLLKLGVLTLNLFGFPVLHRLRHANLRAASTVAETRPSVSLLVPMRNEAARLAASVPAMLGQNADEIIVLDDESTDGTGALARSLLGPHSAGQGPDRRPGAVRMGRQELGLPAAGRRSVRIAAGLLRR